jgi:hypothetical protein
VVALCDSPEQPIWPSRYSSLVALVGGMLALYVFMEDTLRALPDGVEKLIDLRPERFDWPLFLLAFVLLSAPVVELAWQVRIRHILGALPDGPTAAREEDTPTLQKHPTTNQHE